MKLMSRFYAFALTILIGAFFGGIVYFVSTPSKVDTNVNGVAISLPIKLDESFEITDAILNEDEITVTISNTKTDENYESTLLSDELEDFVCNVKIYNADKATNKYDCSTETNIVKSMIMEIGEQSVELIKEGY